ncbi:protein Aster-C isoform X2 [Pelobates fuscus]|uniref:protein Aster-C isoform X2 n=1 Tax=Pelobates fuscus TaxID=191477 RepID=UPI002FE45C15
MAVVHRPVLANGPPEDSPMLRRPSLEQPRVIEEEQKSNVSSSTYKQRSEEFRRLFKELPENDKLIVDYACALQKDILLQGRVYLSENCVCFHSNIFRWETSICLNLRDITSMTKEKTARLIPNAIQISTENEKYFFTSFAARDRSFLNLFRMWQNVLLDKSLTKKEFWQLVQQSYGAELGLNNEDMETVSLPSEDNGPLRAAAKVTCEDVGERTEKTSRGSSLTRDSISQTEADGPSMNFLQMLSTQAVIEEGEKSGSPLLGSERKGNLRASIGTPALALDLNGNENQHEDGSSCTDTPDEGYDKGLENQIEGRLYINRTFHISAERMFQLHFTESPFMQTFLDSRKVLDVEYGPWQLDDAGNQHRIGTYTITLNNPLIGKFTTATEKQTLLKESQDGQLYIVQREVVTHDVPYHDYFYSVHKYIIARTSRHKCKLRVCSDLKYKKQPWGIVKTLIERNSWSGLDEYFKQLETDLQIEETPNTSASDVNKSSTIRRRRRHHSRGTGDHLIKHGTQHDLSDLGLYARDERLGKRRDPAWNNKGIVIVMSIFLFALVALNVTLFLKLSKIEHAAQSFYHVHLQRQRLARLHSNDMDNRDHISGAAVRGALQDSITTLEQLKNSLLLLQKSFDLINKSKSEEASGS